MADITELLRGVSPVLETPFTDDAEVDEESFVRVVRHVLATGVTSVMFPGFASEFHKLSDTERERLTALLLAETRERPGVAAVVSVPDHATHLAVRRAVAAVESGADAVNLLPPHLFGPSAAAGLAHVRAVLAAVAPAPVVLQYAPAQTGTTLDAATIRRLAAEHPNLRFVKVESQPPGRLVADLLDGDPAIASLVGYAGVQMLDAFGRGAVGVQPGCSVTELYVEIWRRWEAGDRNGAGELHRRMLPYLTYWMQHIELVVQAEKTISRRRGLIASDHCRAPGRPLDAWEEAMVDRFLAEFTDLLPEVAA